MSATQPAQPAASPQVVNHATCLACGCLCDDITLSVHQNQITAADLACPLGTAWFQADHQHANLPPATINNSPSTPEAALHHAVHLLAASRRPLLTGLNAFPISTQRLAVALADALGAAIDPAHSPAASAHLQATQRKGAITATLGEVKNRADVVVFWNVDPLQSHPRHLERYSVDPLGRFLEGPRHVLAAAATPNATSRRASSFLTLRPRHEQLALQILRQLIRGLDLDTHLLDNHPALPLTDLEDWATALRAAHYGAWFYEPSADVAREELLLDLVRELNQHTRFVALTLGAPANAAGAKAVLTWQTGYPLAVDFSPGYPRFSTRILSAENLLARGEVDLALLLGEPGELSPAARAHLDQIPRIVIDPAASSSQNPTVGLNCSTPGIHQAGAVMRTDGLTLPLRPPLTSLKPTADFWLQSLLEAIQEGARA